MSLMTSRIVHHMLNFMKTMLVIHANVSFLLNNRSFIKSVGVNPVCSWILELRYLCQRSSSNSKEHLSRLKRFAFCMDNVHSMKH